MSIVAAGVRGIKAPRRYFVIALAIMVVLFAIILSNRDRHGTTKNFATSTLPNGPMYTEIGGRAYAPVALKPQASAFAQKQGIADGQPNIPNDAPDAAAGRRIVRNASIEMIVQHPAEAADQITALAENLGGCLVTTDGAGQNATLATVTVFVPVAHFEEARAEIRKLGVRVENEKFEARDVTEQYVDQAATIRNLQAQELQYLEILKQANNVNNMMMVAEKLSEVRGMIEKQQAEFNSLSHRAETVAIVVSLRTEREQQVFGLDWRPLYELKAAAADALAELVNYGVAMATILLYLPAVLLWAGTLFLAAVFGWRTVQWVRRRWSGWTAAQSPVQG